MLQLIREQVTADRGVFVYLEAGVVHFDALASVTPARAKQILEDALEALNKWSLEQ